MIETKEPQFTNPNYQPTVEIDSDTSISNLTPDEKNEFRRRGDWISTGLPSVDAAENLHRHITDLEVKAKRLATERDEAIQAKMIDEMTGFYTKDYFDKHKNESFDPNYSEKNQNGNYDARQEMSKVCLVYIDMNNLKETNDTKGHMAGDQLIKQEAEFIRSIFRADDILIRDGAASDEFTIVCRNEQNDNNFEAELLEKIKNIRQLEGNGFAYGVVLFDENLDTNLDDTKRRAEQFMYARKVKMKNHHFAIKNRRP